MCGMNCAGTKPRLLMRSDTLDSEVNTDTDNDVLLLHATYSQYDGNILHMKADRSVDDEFNFIFAEANSRRVFTVDGGGNMTIHRGGLSVKDGATVHTGGLEVKKGGATIGGSGLTVSNGGATIDAAGGLFVNGGGATVNSGGLTVRNGFNVSSGSGEVVSADFNHTYVFNAYSKHSDTTLTDVRALPPCPVLVFSSSCRMYCRCHCPTKVLSHIGVPQPVLADGLQHERASNPSRRHGVLPRPLPYQCEDWGQLWVAYHCLYGVYHYH